MAKILLGVSGGVAAYKALELIRLATAAGHSMRVIQTPNSQRFVGAASFEALTGAPVLVSEFEADPARGAFPGELRPQHTPIGHLELSRKADLILIAPASANTLAKLAHGFADNLLTSSVLAASCPVLLAPAMNNHMYEHPGTQANIETLRERGATVLQPGEGRLASVGEQGVGRLPEPAELLAACERRLARHGSWSGVRVLITAGGTREPIDGVRFVGNRSSGRMGLALAEAAIARGAEVKVIAANVSLPRPAGASWVQASTAAEMQDACEQELGGCDVLLMAAAVADFRPATPLDGKMKKEGRDRLSLDLEATPDILSALASLRSAEQTIVGFAAEHGEEATMREGAAKLARKQLDAIVVNDVSRTDIGFESEQNEVHIFANGWQVDVGKAGKREVAEAILDAVQRLRAERIDRR